MQGPGFRTAFTVLTLTALTFLLSLPALAQEEGEVPDTTTPASETTVPGVQIEPAVPIVPVEETPGLMDWTYRYMIPAGLVLALVVILLTSIRYFTNVVRKRYRIVE